MQERALTHEKIKPIWDSVVEDILDAKQGKVTGVKLKNLKTNKVSDLPCAGVFVAIGHLPNTDIFKGQIDMNEAGYIVPQGVARTNIEGVFVAGDVADAVYRQAVTAAGTGCAAAIEAERFLAARKTS
jgi:thioredoxin reductase (NADPH)